MKQMIVTVTESEKDEIEQYWERLNSLYSLNNTLASNNALFEEKSYLYEKIVSDVAITKKKVDTWWESTFEKYCLEKNILKECIIEFSDCTIYLKSNSNKIGFDSL